MERREGGGTGPSGGLKPRRRNPWSRWIARVVVIGIFVAFLAGAFYAVSKGVNWYRDRSAVSTTEEVRGTPVKVNITPGMTAAEIASLLEREGVIGSSAEFVDLVKARGSEDSLRPGIYQFYRDQKVIEVIEWLEQGKGSPSFKVTIPEGLAVSQVSALLDEQGEISGEIYARLSSEPEKFKVPKVGDSTPDVETLEGLLFPSTYYLIEGEGAVELIGAQLNAFQAKTASLPWKNASSLGVTPYEVVTIASLIEKEVSVAEERVLVAAVIYNRLKSDMSLGIDATVRYALGKWRGSLTESDLAVDSPYNTRIVKGLPPTPIASPGVDALEAALAPAEVDYLYYVLKDTEGHHFFTSSYEEFLEAKKNQPQQ